MNKFVSIAVSRETRTKIRRTAAEQDRRMNEFAEAVIAAGLKAVGTREVAK